MGSSSDLGAVLQTVGDAVSSDLPSLPTMDSEAGSGGTYLLSEIRSRLPSGVDLSAKQK